MGSQISPIKRLKQKASHIARRVSGEHSVPVFEGPLSRRHCPVSLLELRHRATHWRRSGGQTFSGVQTFLQFAGFPRSGHSLIGSLIDAHPAATVSHELDILGLVDAGWSQRDIFSLIGAESTDFMRNGRYWNGFAYVVPRQFNGEAAAPSIMGDKKGDWAVRRLQRDPALLDRLHEVIGLPCKWLLVVRNPFDNIATMSLRRGGAYDRLRISSPDAATFRAALEAETGKSISSHADDAMVDDYIDLCRGIAAMRAQIAPQDWLEIGYEDFAQSPVEGLGKILDFLGLPQDAEFIRDAASIVRVSENRSRNAVNWSDVQIRRVRDAIAEFDFLALGEQGEPQ